MEHLDPLDIPAPLDLDPLVDIAVAGLRSKRGRAPTMLREIQAEDLPRLQAAPKAVLQKGPLARVRTTHHLAAREIASGKDLVEVSYITGYTTQRLVQLKNDPAFQELLAYYGSQQEAKWLNVQERLATLGVAVVEEMQHRLETVPDKITDGELRKWAETLLDRSGHGASRTVNVNAKSMTASLIEVIKREAAEETSVRLLPAAE